MSDEQAPPPPPALRLKPRLRPADGPAGAAGTGEPPAFPPPPPMISVPPAVGTPPAETPAIPKVRFTPRLPNPTGTGEPGAVRPTIPAAEKMPEAAPGMSPPAMPNPVVTAPAPPLFVNPPAPITTPPLFIIDPAPAPPAAATAGSPAAADPAKFKLKPKSPPTISPPSVSSGGAAPPVFAPPSPAAAVPPVFTPPAAPVPPPAARPPAVAAKAPPPFPVMAPAGAVAAAASSLRPPVSPGAKTIEPFPKADTRPPVQKARRSGMGSGLLKIAAVLVLAGGGFFAWTHFKPASAPEPKSSAPKSTSPTATANASPTPSETLNKLAHAPANAINKAQEAIANSRASGQARIDAASIGEELPDQPAGSAPGAATKQAPAPKQPAANVATSTAISPNVAATTHLEAAPEASTSFRSFVANAKVSGVFQGTPARAVINGRLTRVGETVDVTLGINFEGVDSARRHLVFKDKSGAVVSRRF